MVLECLSLVPFTSATSHLDSSIFFICVKLISTKHNIWPGVPSKLLQGVATKVMVLPTLHWKHHFQHSWKLPITSAAVFTGKEEQDTDLLMSEQQHILLQRSTSAVKGCTSADASHLWPGQKGEIWRHTPKLHTDGEVPISSKSKEVHRGQHRGIKKRQEG